MATTQRPRPEGERMHGDDRTSSPMIAKEEIARRAYERYEERGSEPGHDVDDWLEAERELRQHRSTE